MTRTHWVGDDSATCASGRGVRSGRGVQSGCRLVLFAVSDGSGSGVVEFDFGSSVSFGCTTAKGLRVEVVMTDHTGNPPAVTGCKFSHHFPALGVVGYNITVL